MTFTQRSFRNIEQFALLAAVDYLPWDSIGSLPDANLKVIRLNSLLVAVLDRFAPLQTYNRREANSLTWFDDAVLSAIVRILVIGLQGHLRTGIGSILYVTGRRRL
jgi:hypothetical protein